MTPRPRPQQDLLELPTWCGAVLLALAVAACSGPPPEVTRFITQEPAGEFDVADFATPQLVASWDFSSAEEVAAWQPLKVDGAFEGSPEGLRVQSSDADPQLVRTVAISASAVDAIELRTESGREGRPQIFWARAGEHFSSEREQSPTSWRLENGERVHRFELASLPSWEGEIVRLRIDPTALAGEEVRLLRASAVAYEAIADLDKAILEPWRVEVDREVRNVLLAPAGKRIVRQLVVPAAGELRFGWTLLPGLRPASEEAARKGPTREPTGDPALEVSVEESDREPVVVFEAALEKDGQGWHDTVVDLARFAGREVRVVLQSTGSSADGSIAMAAWAHPEVGPAERLDTRPNVVLISIDTLRADRLSVNGYPRTTSPNLDAWAAKHGINFSNTVAAAPWTLPSHVSMFSGLDLFSHGVDHEGSVPRPRMLAQMLRDEGYFNVAVTGGGFLHPRYGFGRGFDAYRYWSGMNADEVERGVDAAIEWTRSLRARPFLLFFHTYEVHAPYRAREPYFAGFRNTDDEAEAEVRIEAVPPDADAGHLTARHRWLLKRPDTSAMPVLGLEAGRRLVSDLYDSGVANADAEVGRLLAALAETGLERDTLVVVTSDHGEALGEHGQISHGHVFDHDLMVPLILALPGRLEGGREVTRQVRSIDILPTVLELLELPPVDGVDGRSLVPLLSGGDRESERRPAWSYAANTNFGAVLRLDNRLKYVLSTSPWPQLRGREAVYNLMDDPQEERNIATAGDFDPLPMRREVWERLERMPGLRIEFRNASTAPMRGSMQGGPLGIYNVKGEVPCDCVEVRGRGAGRSIAFQVPPNVGYTLSVEDAADGTIDFEFLASGESEGVAASGVAIELGSLLEAWTWVYEETAWRRWDGAGDAWSTGVSVRWQGGRPPIGKTQERDEALAAELRDLGYLQ